MSGMDDLSMLQKRVLTFVKSFINNYGYPPTVREIAAGTDIKSTSTVHSALNALEQKGYINRDSKQSRSTVLSSINSESGIYSIPLISHNGKDINFGFVDIPKSLLEGRKGVFAVKIHEDFPEKSILKGDVLIAVSCSFAEEGDIGITEEKRPCVCGEDTKIIGKVLASIRHF